MSLAVWSLYLLPVTGDAGSAYSLTFGLQLAGPFNGPFRHRAPTIPGSLSRQGSTY